MVTIAMATIGVLILLHNLRKILTFNILFACTSVIICPFVLVRGFMC